MEHALLGWALGCYKFDRCGRRYYFCCCCCCCCNLYAYLPCWAGHWTSVPEVWVCTVGTGACARPHNGWCAHSCTRAFTRNRCAQAWCVSMHACARVCMHALHTHTHTHTHMHTRTRTRIHAHAHAHTHVHARTHTHQHTTHTHRHKHTQVIQYLVGRVLSLHTDPARLTRCPGTRKRMMTLLMRGCCGLMRGTCRPSKGTLAAPQLHFGHRASLPCMLGSARRATPAHEQLACSLACCTFGNPSAQSCLDNMAVQLPGGACCASPLTLSALRTSSIAAQSPRRPCCASPL